MSVWSLSDDNFFLNPGKRATILGIEYFCDRGSGVLLSRLCDFNQSHVTFSTKDRVNTSRTHFHARCIWERSKNEPPDELFLIAPCRSERLYVNRKLFREPNFEFGGVWSRREYMILRTPLTADPSGKSAFEIEYGELPGRFSESRIEEHFYDRFRKLSTDQDVVAAAREGAMIMARTTVSDEASGQTVVVEYPVTTINYSESLSRFQVDTGPILWPDFDSKMPLIVAKTRLAYIAYNTYSDGEVVLRVPTAITSGFRELARTWYYSQVERISAKHELFRIEHEDERPLRLN